MNEDEKYLLILNGYRALRNQFLGKTDILMNLLDRFTPEQIEILKIYRNE